MNTDELIREAKQKKELAEKRAWDAMPKDHTELVDKLIKTFNVKKYSPRMGNKIFKKGY